MNIWFITDECFPFFGGGIATYIDQCSRLLSNKNMQVTIFVPNYSDPENVSIEHCGNIRICRFAVSRQNLNKQIFQKFGLAYIICDVILNQISIDKTKPDIIETQDVHGLGYFLLWKRFLKNTVLNDIPIIVQAHTPTFITNVYDRDPVYQRRYYYLHQIERESLALADSVVCPGEYLKRIFVRSKVNKHVKKIVYPFENIYEVQTVNNQEEVSKTIDILFIGRLEYLKGIEQVLDRLVCMWNIGFQFGITIVGPEMHSEFYDEPLGERLKSKYIEYIRQGRIIFLDKQKQKIVFMLMKKCKCLIVPSLYDNFPHVCMEAMSIGVPLLVSSSGGQKELVGTNGLCGLIFDWDKLGDFENKLIKILKYDRKKLDKMSMAAQERIKSICNYDYNYRIRYKYYRSIIKLVNAKDNYRTRKILLDPLLSIIIPFNENYKSIAVSLTAVMNSDYANREILIIVNKYIDKDKTTILNEIIDSSFPQVRIVAVEHDLNNISWRNEAIRNSRGKYISFLYPQSYVNKDYYRKALEVLNLHSDIKFVYSWWKLMAREEKLIVDTHRPIFPHLLINNPIPSFAVIDKKIFEKIGFYNIRLNNSLAEHDLWIRACKKEIKGVCLPEVLGSQFPLQYCRGLEENKNARDYFRSIMVNEHKYLYKKYAVQLFNYLNSAVCSDYE